MNQSVELLLLYIQRFTVNFSTQFLGFLDVLISIQKDESERRITTSVYSKRLPSLKKFIKKSINKLYADEQMKKCFPEGSLLVSHKKTPNLKQILVDERYNNRNKAHNLPANDQVNETALEKGIFLYNRKCQMCQKQHSIP